ncbi:MAG TPA: hypothetical protein VE223_04090 [Nitrososphaeraceae archaeon]|nr:hypothetical protein [Nitrososphaeraceae archaeon]
MDNKDNNQKTDTSYGEKNEEIPLQQPTGIDWQKTIGTIVRSKDNLDMGTVIQDDDTDYRTSYSLTIEYGDRQRFSIPKETIYKIDKEYDKTYIYTTLTENEILASGKDDPFYTSMRSYTGD